MSEAIEISPDPGTGSASAPPFESLHRNARWPMRISSALGFMLLLAGATFAALLLLGSVLEIGRGAAAAGLGVAVLLAAVLGWNYANAAFRRIRYRLDDTGLEIHRGLLWRSETRIPRSRVQHTDINRGPLDRRLGLATLKVYTAGTRLASVDLDGLPAARAVELRDALLAGHDDAI